MMIFHVKSMLDNQKFRLLSICLIILGVGKEECNAKKSYDLFFFNFQHYQVAKTHQIYFTHPKFPLLLPHLVWGKRYPKIFIHYSYKLQRH